MEPIPIPISDARVAFPGHVSDLMPRQIDIPEEFKNGTNPWCAWQNDWFFNGLPTWPQTKSGFDPDVVKRHLHALQTTLSTKHEHKMSAVAYLASLWLELPGK